MAAPVGGADRAAAAGRVPRRGVGTSAAPHPLELAHEECYIANSVKTVIPRSSRRWSDREPARATPGGLRCQKSPSSSAVNTSGPGRPARQPPSTGIRRAGHERRVVGEQERDRGGDLRRLAEPLHHLQALDHLPLHVGSWESAISRSTSGVAVAPGCTALQRMPCVAYSTPIARTIAPTAAFEIE